MKSHVSTLQELATCILKDTLALCAATESAERDIITLRSRVEHEGLSFLTITLPSFGQDFERSLEQGSVDPSLFRSFRKKRRIPAFLQGIFGLVFDADTGDILKQPSVEAIKCIRQIAYAFKKLKLACSPDRVSKAYHGYIRDELDLEVPVAQRDVDKFVHVARVMWSWLSDERFRSTFDFIPKHGPGATADRISGNAKWRFASWHERLEQYFPLDSYALANANALDSDVLEKVTLVSEGSEQPVRVITVPKTLKSPRIIAIEPVCMQYTQQAVARVLIKGLEESRVTAGHVNFTDQSVNRDLAMSSSRDMSMATLDMSSASDRVPLSLAIRMFDMSPELQGAILACRSTRAQLPTGEILSLRKFASMGSALCFPVESMYFYTLCVMALLEKRKLPVTSQNIYKMSRDVYIYGDDIILPTGDAADVVNHLQKYYCKVNMSKSFWKGKFRESCGMDAFDGEEVTPTYVREVPPNDMQDASALVSWVQSSNLFYKNGFWLTSSFLLNECERLLGVLPVVGDRCAGLGKVSFMRGHTSTRISARYQCPEVRTWVACPVYRTDKLSGYPALLKCLLRLEARLDHEPSEAGDHLSRTARFGAVTLKRRWVRPY